MRVVAEHLEIHAKKVQDAHDRDLFARSAFNRYYYATFLTIRSTLASIDPDWDEPAHNQVPTLLRESVVKRFKKRAQQRILSPTESEVVASRGCTAAKALADLIEIGNVTRKIADYCPKHLVLFENSAFSLGGVKASAARKWSTDAQTRCKVLLNAAQKFGLC